MKRQTFIAAACAIVALAQSQIAFAQAQLPACVQPADLSDAVIYAMPSIVGAVKAKCTASLPATGFINTKGDAYAGQFVALQDKTWPGAQRLLMQFTKSEADKSGNGDELANMLQTLPPEALQPFVDAIVQQKVAEAIPLKKCSEIERGVALLAPLPPENIGGLMTFILEIANVKNPTLCAAKHS